MAATADLFSGVAELVKSRVPAADLDERDPDYIRENLPRLWLLASLYFRGEVRGPRQHPRGRAGAARRQPLRRQPDARTRSSSRSPSPPTSGSSAPSTSSPTTSSSPCPGCRSCASTAPSPPRTRTPAKALQAGAAVLVYPGGDYEVHRPVWERSSVDFDGRKGFIRARARAGRADRPRRLDRRAGDVAVPLAAASGCAKVLRPRQAFRLKVLPISIAPPWGLNIGDMLGHLPLPAKITIEALPPIDLRERVRRRPRPRRGLRPPHAADAGDPRRARRRAPLPGDRMRVASKIEISAPPELVWALRRRPLALPALHVRHHALGGRRRASAAASARATGCSCASARPRSAGSSRSSSTSRDARHGVDVGHRRRPARPLAPARRATTAAPASSCASPTASPAPGISGWLAEHVAAPDGPRPPAPLAAAAQAPGRARAAALPRRAAALPAA